MSQLTILFHQMFFLVNRTNGATVLVPSTNHTAWLSGTNIKEKIQLTQAEVNVRQKNVDLADRPTLRPGARYLPYFDYVFHSKVAPLPQTKAALVPDNLNARVKLVGGHLTELPLANKAAADHIWNFITTDKVSTLEQRLTDRLMYTLDLDDAIENGPYALVVRMNGVETVIEIPNSGAEFTIYNQDIVQKPQAIDGLHRLTEYSILYDLTSASTSGTLYPIPTRYSAEEAKHGFGQSLEEVCTAGQGDGGDDPPDPPPGV